LLFSSFEKGGLRGFLVNPQPPLIFFQGNAYLFLFICFVLLKKLA
jgi:hypothetical protein